MRDDFAQKVKETLAHRVGMKCSAPDCRQPTSGPHSSPDRAVNYGKASHITAAAVGGPRYDANFTPEQRRSVDNGIWLCGLHADMVDKDEPRFSVEQLHEWKRQAEDLARKECETRWRAEGPAPALAQASRVLTMGREFAYGFDADKVEAQFGQVLALFTKLIKRAFVDTYERTPYDDFVFVGSFHLPPQRVGGKDPFAFEMTCHVTHFISAFDEMLSTVIANAPDEWDARLAGYYTDVHATIRWRVGKLIPFRVSRTGPNAIEVIEAKPIRSIDAPFSTSSLLTLLSHAKSSGVMVLEHADDSEETQNLFRYLAAAQERGSSSWDDVILDRANAERFYFPPELLRLRD
jgi:hypothetical protein